MKKIIPTLIITTMAGLHAQAAVDPNFNYKVDRFADIEVLSSGSTPTRGSTPVWGSTLVGRLCFYASVFLSIRW